jgi:hypothetical protein
MNVNGLIIRFGKFEFCSRPYQGDRNQRINKIHLATLHLGHERVAFLIIEHCIHSGRIRWK